MTQNTDQDRTEFEDGAWYWVEKEGWHDEPPEVAPAMYRANANAWYSFRFGGIPTREIKVLEPCIMQAARRAQVVPEGWKAVPVEPTDGQLKEAVKSILECTWTEAQDSREFNSVWLEAKDAYAAMLAAAPTPPLPNCNAA